MKRTRMSLIWRKILIERVMKGERIVVFDNDKEYFELGKKLGGIREGNKIIFN